MSGLDSTVPMQQFVDRFGLPFPSTVSEDGTLWARFGIQLQGAWVFVNDDGKSQVVPYDLYEDDLEKMIQALIAA